MDSHRLLHTVIDPKVRQVGFVTLGEPSAWPVSEPVTADPPSPGISTGISISPVMIIPPRHASSMAVTVPATGTPMSPGRGESMPIGSYNPSESLLGTSPSVTAVDGGSKFSEDVVAAPGLGQSGLGKFVASSFPRSSGEMMWMKAGTHAPVVKVLPGVSGTLLGYGGSRARAWWNETFVEGCVAWIWFFWERISKPQDKDGGAFLDTQTEGSGTSTTMKRKMTKADRCALQEAQRTPKAAAKGAGVQGKASAASGGGDPASQKQGKAAKPPPQKKDGPQVTAAAAASDKKVVDRLPEKDRKKDVPPPRMQFDDKHRVDKAKRRAVVNQSEARNRVELFLHLAQYVHGTQLPDLESKFFQLGPIHPSVYKVGLQYLSGDISGGNARCIAMLLAFQDAIKDHTTPPEKLLSRDLAAKISSYVSFLIERRPLSISMGNAIKFLKDRIVKLQDNFSEAEAKSSLCSDIDRFINEKIVIADKVIVRHAVTKIRDGDVLLTYGSPCVVEMILFYAHELGKQFRVVVVDARPKLEGQRLLHRLVAKGIICTYTHVNAISYIMHEVTRVFLGASSVLSNGTVYSRVGTACVAMVAHAFRVPVLICCEAYKFHERVQLDSICSNELGDPDVISKVHGRNDVNCLENWAEKENLQLLNLTYDATPSDYISVIVTDYGMLPPTSVPVIVREYRRENVWV